MIDCYATVQGNSTQTISAIRESQFKIGATTDSPPIAGRVAFADYPFKTDDFSLEDHIARVREWTPELAVAPDIMGSRPPSRVFSIADRLLEYADNVIVVPKTIAPESVPGRFRVGYPNSRYSDVEAFPRSRLNAVAESHLLGGSPNSILEGVQAVETVASIDTAHLVQFAGRSLWDGVYVDESDLGLSTDRQERLTLSLDNLWLAINAVDRGERYPPLADRYDATAVDVDPTFQTSRDREADLERLLAGDQTIPAGREDTAETRRGRPCQVPDCTQPAVSETGYCYCAEHEEMYPGYLEG